MLWLTLLLPLCHASAPRRISGYDIASHLFKKSVDFAADPCEDFFQFACGKWSDSTPIPTHASSVSHFSKLEDRIKKQLRGLFESPIVVRSRSIMTLKAMYRKCTDMDELNRIGARQLIHFLSLHYGVWPMIHGSNRWSPTHFDLTHLMELMALRALSVFVGVDVALNPRNVARYAISITMGELALGKSSAHYYLDRKKHGKRIEAYRQLMFNETRLIHEDVNMSFEERKTMMYVDEIIEFETKLAKILNDAEEHKDPAKSHHMRRLSDLRLLLPLIDWERYFIHMSPRKVHRYLARNPKIVIENIDYLKRLTKLLQSTEPRIITNYMFVRFVRSRENELGDHFEDVVQSFARVMLGKKTKTPRWKYCMQKNMERMKFASGALYVRNVFQKVTKKAAENMVADLRATMEELIREGNWMDMKTKEAALEKARMILQHIAYPEFILNDRLLDKYYRGISIRETDSYSEMVEKFLRWQRRSSYEKLLHPADRNESELDAAEANAFYSSSRNSINIPAAILQAPLFDSTFPRALNYGGIGAIIGHEITHGFDDEGRMSDAIGNVRDWWTRKSAEKYENRSQCFVEQYGNVLVPGTALHLNGKTTQGENIADNGGVKLAFRAYKKYLKRHGREKPITGFARYSNEQMFFMGYAMANCARYTKDALMNKIVTDAHPPSKYRVNVGLANQPEFAEAFKCRVGTPMNPQQRCNIW